MTDDFRELFELMNRWRHLPKYKFEGNLQPFFGLFLKDLMKCSLGIDICETVIPEFPLPQEDSHNYSNNIDYLALDSCKRIAYLVELKTDMNSIDDGQMERYLKVARTYGFYSLVEVVVSLAQASGQHHKYIHLLHQLDALGFLKLEEKLYTKQQYPHQKRETWGTVLKLTPLTAAKKVEKMEVVYIQPKKATKPTKNGFHCVDFADAAECLEKYGGLRPLFAEHLRHWIEEAGYESPKNF